jgi:hypothetical protein
MLLQNVQIRIIFDLKLIDPRFAHSDHSEPFGDMKKKRQIYRQRIKQNSKGALSYGR